MRKIIQQIELSHFQQKLCLTKPKVEYYKIVIDNPCLWDRQQHECLMFIRVFTDLEPPPGRFR